MSLRPEYGLPPDPLIEYYKQDVDRTLLREHLKLTPQQRLEKLVAFMRGLEVLAHIRAAAPVIPDLVGLIRVLSGGGVQYIVVGGVAAGLHGALRTTLDLDVVYARDPGNVARLVLALTPYAPYLRGAPPGLPFKFDEATVARGLNFTLVTTLGDLDLLGEVTGGGDHTQLRASAEPVDVAGFECWVVTLPKLIALKRAAGRAKDREALAELEALLEERDGPSR